MKCSIKYCVSIIAMTVLYSCSSIVYKDLWQPQPLQVNGNPKDAPHIFDFYDTESSLYYTFSNDLDNFYITIKTTNQQTQLSILRSGIRFNIDTTGKFGEPIKILFPFEIKQVKKSDSNDRDYSSQNANSRGRRQGTAHNQDNYSSLKQKFIEENKSVHLFGFKYPISGAIPLPNDYNIKMNITWDSTNAMLFQSSIPFATFYKKSLSIADSSKVFGIAIKLTGIQSAQTQGGMGSGGMGGNGLSMGMGMGSMGMGGMGMGMGGMGFGMGGMGVGMRIPIGSNSNGMGNSPANQQNRNIKVKIKLAVRPE
jgi:hypothetical protein